MKIGVRSIPPGGMTLDEQLDASSLDLETEVIKFRGPLHLHVEVTKDYDVVSVHAVAEALLRASCSRCLEEFDIGLKKKLQLNYPVTKAEMTVDVDPDIREEVMLQYPVKPLCNAACKGLCPACGANLNKGGCNCGST